MKSLLRSSLLLYLFLLAIVPAFSQTFGEITGRVTDASGGVVADASVTVTNVNTNASRQSTTNQTGDYSFPSLPPGVYNLRIERQGFKSEATNNVEVQVQQTVRLDFAMQVGQTSDSVVVEASAAQLQAENATVGTVIDNKRIVELPLNGRNFLQLVSLTPNVTTASPSAGQASARQGGDRAGQSIAVAGQRIMFDYFSLDGVNNTDPNFNTYVVLPSIDALQEFKVQTGVYPAEFGRNATQINVLTKSGGNQYHGALFEFLRNDVLDARPYSFTAIHAPKSPFKWNQYGYTLGGPVSIPKLFNGRDKLFFLSNYESFRQRQNSQNGYTVPTAAQFGGDFSGLSSIIYDPATRVQNANGTFSASPFPGNIIPRNRIDPVSTKLLQYYAPANLSTTNNNFVRQDASPINKDQLILRMDYVESSRSQWAGRYSWGDENQANEGLTLDGTKVITNFEQYMGSNTRTITPTIINEARFGYTRFFNSLGTFLATASNVVDTIGIPGLKGGDPVQWGIPNVTLANYSSIGDSTEGPYANSNNSLQFVDNVSLIKGSHTIRFGGEFRRDHYNQVGNQFARGQFTFQANATQNPANKTGGNSFAEFLLGQLYQSEAAVAVGNAKFLQNSFAIYIDDTWKLTPKLTLALGLRYENTPPYYNTLGNLFSVSLPYFDTTPNVADKSRYPSFIRQGKGTDPYAGISIRWPAINVTQDGHLGDRLVARDNNDFAPRIGITYSPNSKWVIRTGGGMFYNQDTGNPRFDMARNIAGRIRTNASLDTPNLLWGNALSSIASGGVANITTPYAFANLYNRRTPYSLQYLFNVQRELAKDIVIEVGYIGSVSHKLESLRAVNEALPGATGSVNSRQPYPNFGRIQLVDNSTNANYNAGSVKLTKRYSAGLTLLTSYTYAKSIDDSSGIRVQGQDTLFPQNSNCLRCERALSAFDTRHRFVTSFLYDLPFGKGRQFDLQNAVANGVIGGWQAGAIWTVQTGFPQTANIGGIDRSGAGGLFDRPNATGISPNLDSPTPSRWFNPAAFVLQPAGTFGNVGRNTLIGPKFFTLDFSAHKEFRMPYAEQHALQVRFEAFNVMNHPVWGAPNSNIQSTGFGTVTGTAVPMRQLQLAMKYIF